MKKIKLFLVFSVLLAINSFAQTHKCGENAMQQAYWSQHPERANERAAMQAGRAQLDETTTTNQSVQGRFPQAVLTIPVVFHIIHSGESIGTGRNISMTKIQEQLQILNQDYSKTNRDANQIPAQFQSIAANTEIQFCLAAIDPSGAATTGVTRHQYNSISDNNYIENTIKPATTWNARRYLNIWVLEMPQSSGSGFVLGYAYLPEPSMVGSNIDGFVVDYRYVGTTPNIRSYGRTATHEIGHYLGLLHPWGMNENDCQNDAGAEDDGISDTPFSSSPNFTPSSQVCGMTPVQCGHTIFGSNYMDYSDDPCMNAFSNGQKTVMRAVVTGSATIYGFGSRAELVNNAATTCNQNPGSTCANPYNAAYNMGFEANENPTTWATENTNGDTNNAGNAVTWSIGNGVQVDGDYGPHNGTQFADYYYNDNAVSGGNDWLFSKCQSLQTGKTYSLKFWYAVGKTSSNGTVYPEKLKVMIGTAPASGGMTTLIGDLGTLTNAYPNYQQASYDFSISQNGDYYLGFKCYSDPDRYILMLDDVNLTGRLTTTNDFNDLSGAIKMYPNPATNEFCVQLSAGFDTHNAYITVTDVAGKQITQKAWEQGFERTFIHTTNYMSGLYFVTLHIGNETFTQKIVVAK